MLAFDVSTGSGSDVGHKRIDASGSLVADCMNMLDTSAAASVVADEHTSFGHAHVFEATKPMPERPTEACGRWADRVVAYARLPQP